MNREPVAGPEQGPEAPFPIRLRGRIVKGFGRGSKELGIPTANIPVSGLEIGGYSDIESGVYFGWAGLDLASKTSDPSKVLQPPGAAPPKGDEALNVQSKIPEATRPTSKTYPMVMSIGWNPFFKNKVRSVEVHIISKFSEDFYNAKMTLSILAFIRPERDYDSMEGLIQDINADIEVSERSLQRPAYVQLSQDQYLLDFDWEETVAAH